MFDQGGNSNLNQGCEREAASSNPLLALFHLHRQEFSLLILNFHMQIYQRGRKDKEREWENFETLKDGLYRKRTYPLKETISGLRHLLGPQG